MKRFGYFRGLSKDQARAELERLRSDVPRQDEKSALGYLKGGNQLCHVLGISTDLLSEQKRIIGPPCIYSDGVWLWTSDAIFYVEEYHIEVPEEFRSRMAEFGWKCPLITDTQALREEGWDRWG
jgi:hypothetical protein